MSKLSELSNKLSKSVTGTRAAIHETRKVVDRKRKGKFVDTVDENFNDIEEINEAVIDNVYEDDTKAQANVPKKKAPVEDDEAGPYAKHFNSIINILNDIRNNVEETVETKKKQYLEKRRDIQEKRRERRRKRLSSAVKSTVSTAKTIATPGLAAGLLSLGVPSFIGALARVDDTLESFGVNLADFTDAMNESVDWINNTVGGLKQSGVLDNAIVALGNQPVPKIMNKKTPKPKPKPEGPKTTTPVKKPKILKGESGVKVMDSRAVATAGGKANYKRLIKYGFKWAPKASSGKGMWIDTRVGSRGFIKTSDVKAIAKGLKAEEGSSVVRFLRIMSRIWSKSGKPVLVFVAKIFRTIAKVFSWSTTVIGIPLSFISGIGKWIFRGAALIDPIMALVNNKSVSEVKAELAGSFGMLFGAWIGGMALGFIGAFAGAVIGEAAGQIGYWLLVDETAPNWEKAKEELFDLLIEPAKELGYNVEKWLSMDDTRNTRLRQEKLSLENKKKYSGLQFGPGPARETFTEEDQARLNQINKILDGNMRRKKTSETITGQRTIDSNYFTLTEKQKDEVAKTLLAEAENKNASDMTYISWVIRNRANRSDMNAYDTVSYNDGKQFAGWLVRNKAWSDEQIQMARSILSNVFSVSLANDPTKGADHYYAPDLMDKPQWAKNLEKGGAEPLNLNGSPHVFYRAYEAGYSFPGMNNDVMLKDVKSMYEPVNIEIPTNTTKQNMTQSQNKTIVVSPPVNSPVQDLTFGNINTGTSLQAFDAYP